MPSSHSEKTDRSKGGPGSSHETKDHPGTEAKGAHHQNKPAPQTPGQRKAGHGEDGQDHGHAGSRGRQ